MNVYALTWQLLWWVGARPVVLGWWSGQAARICHVVHVCVSPRGWGLKASLTYTLVHNRLPALACLYVYVLCRGRITFMRDFIFACMLKALRMLLLR